MNQHPHVEEILFPAVKVRATELFPGKEFADNMSHAIYLPDQEKVIQLCSSTYCLVDNEYLFGQFYDYLVKQYGSSGFEVDARSYDDRKFYCEFTVKQEFEVGKNDSLNPKVIVWNSYDGSIVQRAAIGYMRRVCTNGLMAFSSDLSVKKKHSMGEGKLNLGPIVKQLEKATFQLEKFKRLTDRRLLPREIDELVKKVAGTKYPKKLLPSAPEIAQREAAELGTGLNAWLLYNGFNNALWHSEGKLFPEERERIDRVVLKTIETHLQLC